MPLQLVLERVETSSRLNETLWSRQLSRLGNSLSEAYSRHIDCINSVNNVKLSKRSRSQLKYC